MSDCLHKTFNFIYMLVDFPLDTWFVKHVGLKIPKTVQAGTMQVTITHN